MQEFDTQCNASDEQVINTGSSAISRHSWWFTLYAGLMLHSITKISLQRYTTSSSRNWKYNIWLLIPGTLSDQKDEKCTVQFPLICLKLALTFNEIGEYNHFVLKEGFEYAQALSRVLQPGTLVPDNKEERGFLGFGFFAAALVGVPGGEQGHQPWIAFFNWTEESGNGDRWFLWIWFDADIFLQWTNLLFRKCSGVNAECKDDISRGWKGGALSSPFSLLADLISDSCWIEHSWQLNWCQVLRVGRGDVVKREGLGLVAWPISTAVGKRQKTEVDFKTYLSSNCPGEPDSRGGWLSQAGWPMVGPAR